MEQSLAEIRGRPDDGVAQGRKTLSFFMTKIVALAEVLDSYDGAHENLSDQIRERSFGIAEISQARKEKGHASSDGKCKSRQIGAHLSTDKRPAEPVDHADHRVQGVEQAPFFRDDRAAETNRRYVEPELDQEWDDVPKIPVLDIQGRHPQSPTQSRHHRQSDKKRERENPDPRQILIPEHYSHHQTESDQKIDETDDHRTRRDDDPREIDLGDHIGIHDERIAALGKSIGKQLPGKQCRKNHERIGGIPLSGEVGQFAEQHREDDQDQEGT